MTVKTCFKCGEEKPLCEFYRHHMMRDGRLNKCMDCTKRDVRANRLVNLDHYKQYDKERANKPDRVAAREEYAKSEAGRRAASRARKKYRGGNPQKYKAHTIVTNAVRDGLLARQPCEVCGATKMVHAHHDDYAKPLDVRWLCPAHHRQWHQENGPGLNGAAA